MDFEDYSDLTDIDSDDYKPKAKKKSAGTRGQHSAGGYRIKNVLKVPRATTYTAQALVDQIHTNDINLEAEYQRAVVWPETKQIGIIDSVFRNFYIPPVIFAVNSSDDGSETRICIDGKQRLTSIQRFMDGFIPHKDPLTSEKLWYTDNLSTGNGRSSRPKKLLPEKYRRLFANKQIVCVEYHEITDSDEREIFQRVQLGMALTPAEKLQVVSTPRASFVSQLVTLFLKGDGGLAGDAIEWDQSRGGDFRCLAQAVFCIQMFGPELKNSGSIVKLEKWLSEDEEFSAALKAKVKDTLRVLSDLALDKRLNKVFKKPPKVAPIEFTLICLLVGVHKDKMSRAQLSAAIGKMRDDVRDVHVDIRMNDRVAKTMLDFIRMVQPATIPGDNGVPAGAAVGEKRKRPAEDDVKPKTRKDPPPEPTPPSLPSPRSLPTARPRPAAAPDRMAALRAAKIQASQNSTQTGQSSFAFQTNQPLPQLPSPGQSFTFPSGMSQSFQSSQQQQQFSSFPQQPPQSPLETSLMAHMSRPNDDNRARLEQPIPLPIPYDHEPDYHNPDPGNSSRAEPSGGGWSSSRGIVNRQSDSGWGSRQGHR
ncbi:hypothetical protein Hypma_014369 [Hypsizygus marmoreus]|uniref:GmrSD restriction endonucleases N-terminal domain-containing protein n=1 Tax=Hypsizygus marmoreus TaxID=39966 RepID=A0A369JCT2_HYPMA|nr:hypothetical protein Hypma_014369 [Hypsizygus marmoreus]